MESRVAMLSIVVESPDSVQELNNILHTCSDYIIGRMGIPYKKRSVSLICVALDAPVDVINSLSGKIGNIKGISSKVVYSKINGD